MKYFNFLLCELMIYFNKIRGDCGEITELLFLTRQVSLSGKKNEIPKLKEKTRQEHSLSFCECTLNLCYLPFVHFPAKAT